MKKATISITTFRGVSSDAVHYYGNLGYYDSDGFHAKELKRAITAEEIEKHPDRFYNYSVGDMTECFNGWRDVVDAGNKLYDILGVSAPLYVVGIPNTKQVSIKVALKPIDTRLRCSVCDRVFMPNEGLYNMPYGAVCCKCYEEKYK